MSERLRFQYPTGMAITWTARMLLAMLFVWTTAVYTSIQFTPTRGLWLLAAGLIAIPTVIFGTYSLLLAAVTIELDGVDETAPPNAGVSIRSPFHHLHIPYAEIEQLHVKRGRLLLWTANCRYRLDGRLQNRLIFLHTLRHRSPQLANSPPVIKLTASSSHLFTSLFASIVLFFSGGTGIALAITDDELSSDIMLIAGGILALLLGGLLLKNFVTSTLIAVSFGGEQIEWRTLFRRHYYEVAQLYDMRLERVTYTYKNNKRWRYELYATFKTGEDLRIQQEWVAQALPDFLLLLGDLYPIAPPAYKSAQLVPPQRFGTGSKRPFSAYFEQESNVQVNSVRDIQNWLQKCRYLSDQEQHGVDDHWLHPVEFEAVRQGDCEDHALWAWRKLIGLGIRAEFVTGHHHEGGMVHEELPLVNHAWVVFWQNGRLLLLETTSKKGEMVRPLVSTTRTHQPRFSVNEAFVTFRHDLPKKEAGRGPQLGDNGGNK